jgi:hypothetical protein
MGCLIGVEGERSKVVKGLSGGNSGNRAYHGGKGKSSGG